MVPVENSGTAHVLHRESTMEVFTDVTTNVAFENESATWVIEVVFGKVDNEIINNGDLVTSMDHFHELMVTNLRWRSLELDLSSSIKLEPNFEQENDAGEPHRADNIHAEVESSEHTCLTTNHEKVANEHVQLPLFDSVLRVPFVCCLLLLDDNSLVDNKDCKQE